jgi:hypothetical protein
MATARQLPGKSVAYAWDMPRNPARNLWDSTVDSAGSPMLTLSNPRKKRIVAVT